MNEKTISAEQVAILAERVDVMNLNHAEMKGMLVGMNSMMQTQAQAMAVMTEQMTRSGNENKRLFDRMDKSEEAIDRMNNTLSVHSWTWKLVGSVAVVGLSLGGWMFNQMQSINMAAHGQEKRLTLIEFIVGGRNDFPSVRKPESK